MNRDPIETAVFMAQGIGAILFLYVLWLARTT